MSKVPPNPVVNLPVNRVLAVRQSGPPRKGRSADAPGDYALIMLPKRSVLDSGDYLEVEVFITGYGSIGDAKLVGYPAADVFDPLHSEVISGIEAAPEGLRYGGSRHVVGAEGLILWLEAGWLFPSHHPELTPFVDVTEHHPPQIATEVRVGNAPVVLRFKTLKSARPGSYPLTLHLTYYNGVEWRTSPGHLQFQLRNIFQKHEALIGILGLAAAVATIWPFILWLVRKLGQ